MRTRFRDIVENRAWDQRVDPYIERMRANGVPEERIYDLVDTHWGSRRSGDDPYELSKMHPLTLDQWIQDVHKEIDIAIQQHNGNVANEALAEARVSNSLSMEANELSRTALKTAEDTLAESRSYRSEWRLPTYVSVILAVLALLVALYATFGKHQAANEVSPQTLKQGTSPVENSGEH